jgi:hypothetical protein
MFMPPPSIFHPQQTAVSSFVTGPQKFLQKEGQNSTAAQAAMAGSGSMVAPESEAGSRQFCENHSQFCEAPSCNPWGKCSRIILSVFPAIVPGISI